MSSAFDFSQISSLKPAGRYAPSPTGPLHAGNMATALHAAKIAKETGMRFLLRIEDVDELRCDASYEKSIIRDLKFLGITFDNDVINDSPVSFRQSERTAFYQQAFSFLQENDMVYPCFCSRKEIAFLQQYANATAYPGTCRNLSQDERRYRLQHTVPAWRLKTDDKEYSFYDAYLKKQFRYNCQQHGGDFIVKRKDEFFAYQLAVVVDDILMNVRQVVRGQDLLDNTPWQQALYNALGHNDLLPEYYHLPLILNHNGEKLSKRNKDHALSYWLNQGYTIDHIKNALLNFKLPSQWPAEESDENTR